MTNKSKFQLRCRCLEYRTRWIEQGPESSHRYKVQCDSCGKFIAWGTHEQLMSHGAKFYITLITWKDQEEKPTLNRFFE